MITDLRTIPGIGPATKDRLEDRGIETANELLCAYSIGDASQVRTALHDELSLVSYFLTDSPTVNGQNEYLPPEAPEHAPVLMAFVRFYGVNDLYLSENTAQNTNAKIEPSTVDWSVGMVAEESNVFGLLYDPEKASKYVGVDMTSVTRPSEIEKNSDVGVIEYRCPQSSTTVKDELVDGMEELTGFDYSSRENVYIHDSVDNVPVEFELPQSDLSIICAPSVA